MVIQGVPLTPGANIGVAEAAYEELYKNFMAAPKLKGFLTSIGQRLASWSIALVGLAFYLPLRRTVRQVLAEKPPEPSADGRPRAVDVPTRVEP